MTTEFIVREPHNDTEYVFGVGDVTDLVTIRHRDQTVPEEDFYPCVYLEVEQLVELVAWLVEQRNRHLGVSIATLAAAAS